VEESGRNYRVLHHHQSRSSTSQVNSSADLPSSIAHLWR